MKVLVACEESQTVCKAFRERGHEAYSCDIQPCVLFDHLEWHILDDALSVINGNCTFHTMDGEIHIIDGTWDLLIAHPPCTYLTLAANRSHSLSCTEENKINERTLKRISSMMFFMTFVFSNCEHIAIENPIGVMNTCYRSPDQIIHPYMFAESTEDSENYVTKATCLWIKGLPILKTNSLDRPNNKEIFGVMPSGKSRTWEDSVCRSGGASKARSKTFPGIAAAMAEQWGSL